MYGGSALSTTTGLAYCHSCGAVPASGEPGQGVLWWRLSTSLHSSAPKGSKSTYWFLYWSLKKTLKICSYTYIDHKTCKQIHLKIVSCVNAHKHIVISIAWWDYFNSALRAKVVSLISKILKQSVLETWNE